MRGQNKLKKARLKKKPLLYSHAKCMVRMSMKPFCKKWPVCRGFTPNTDPKLPYYKNVSNLRKSSYVLLYIKEKPNAWL